MEELIRQLNETAVMVFKSIAERRSIRSFSDHPIGDDDFKLMIEAAMMAPSGSNSQPWHFILVKEKELISKIAGLVKSKLSTLHSLAQHDGTYEPEEFGKIGGMVFFEKAPGLVCVLRGKYQNRLDLLLEHTDRALYDSRKTVINPSLQSVAAAITLFLLSAHTLGYGACWMTGPLVAKPEIERLLMVEEPFEMVAMIPIGFPKKIPKAPPRKSFHEIVTIIS